VNQISMVRCPGPFGTERAKLYAEDIICAAVIESQSAGLLES
jgi:hypothetical protein